MYNIYTVSHLHLKLQIQDFIHIKFRLKILEALSLYALVKCKFKENCKRIIGKAKNCDQIIIVF